MGRRTATAFAVNLGTSQSKKRSYISDSWTEPAALQATNSLDCIGVFVNLVAFATDPRYDPGDQYEDANVHLGKKTKSLGETEA